MLQAEENTKLSLNFLKYHVSKGTWGSEGIEPCVPNPRTRWRHLTHGCTHFRNGFCALSYVAEAREVNSQYLEALDRRSWDLKFKSNVGTTNNSEITYAE